MLVDALPGCIEHDQLIWRGRKRAVSSPVLRAFYEATFGPIPEGEHVHHLCGNPWCVAKDHLATFPRDLHNLTHRYRGLSFGFNETAF